MRSVVKVRSDVLIESPIVFDDHGYSPQNSRCNTRADPCPLHANWRTRRMKDVFDHPNIEGLLVANQGDILDTQREVLAVTVIPSVDHRGGSQQPP